MAKAGSKAPLPKGSRLRVLIVEHSQVDVELCVKGLERAGFEVSADMAQTREQFSERLTKQEYDVVLADYRLPGWTGMDALEILEQQGKSIPFIVVTGTLGEERAVECIKQGATDYVLKDHLTLLPVAVRRAVEEQRLRESRKRAEEALRESEDRFRRLVQISPETILVGCGKQAVFINPAGLKLFGAQNESQILGKTVADLVHPDFQEVVLQTIETSQGTDLAVPAREERFRRLDGTYVDVEVIAMPFVWKGKPAMQVIARDITERKRSERERARLAVAIEQANESVFITSVKGEIEFVNPAFTKITGYSRDEALGRSPRFLKSGKHDQPFYQRLWDTILAGEIWRGEIINRKKDKSLYTQRMTITPVRDGAGKLTNFITISDDVTEYRLLEQQFRQVQKMEAIGQLAGGVAHDFNNLLMAISSFTELAGDAGPTNEKQQRYLEEVLKATRRAAGLTQQLLAFSRKQVLAPIVLDLNAVVSDLGKMLPPLIGEHIQVRLLAKSQNSKVEADRGQIEQILMNLAVNARDAMPKGGTLVIEVADAVFDQNHVSSNYTIPAGSYVLLAVSDNGAGMTRDTLEHIFEPFFTTKERDKGTGLGLSTVYGIIKQSGGYISTYSEPGVGTTFKIYLPRAEKPPAPPPAKPEPSAAGGAETILMVEDENAVRIATREFLKTKGYAVLDATNAADALRVLSQHAGRVHLLITDVVMPGMSGPDLAERLKQLDPKLPVLYVSGYTDGAITSVAGVQEGAGFLQKPFALEFLARKVRAILDVAGQDPAIPGLQGANS